MENIKIVIAEDQTMLLDALTTILELEDRFEVVQSCSDGAEVLDFLELNANQKVDIVLTDIEMPNVSGLELAFQLNQKKNYPKVIILTTFSRSGYLRRAMDAGVKGYLLKDSPSKHLIETIKKVHSGEIVISPELMVNSWMEKDPLSDKERKALRLSMDGFSTEEIAKSLFLSQGTVRNYLSSALNKLNAKNRIEAARIAHRNGWL